MGDRKRWLNLKNLKGSEKKRKNGRERQEVIVL